MAVESDPDAALTAIEALGRSVGGANTTAVGPGMVKTLRGFFKHDPEPQPCVFALAPPALHIQPILDWDSLAPAGPPRAISGPEIRSAKAERLELPRSGSIAVNVKVRLADGERLMISVADGGLYGDGAPAAAARVADACAAIVVWLGDPGC